MPVNVPTAPLAALPPTRQRRRMLFWVVAGAIVVSGALVASGLAYLRQQTLLSGSRVTESMALVLEEQTTRTVQTIDQRMELASDALKHLREAKRLDAASARELLQQQLKELPLATGLRVVDASGRIVHDASTTSPAGDIAGETYFRIYLDQPGTGFHIAAPVRSGPGGAWRLMATHPLKAPDGRFDGILVAELDPLLIDRLWRTIDLGQDGAVTLLRKDGTLMMRTPFDAQVMGKNFRDQALMSRYLPTSPAGSFEHASPVDGKVRQVAYRTLRTPPGTLVVVGRSVSHVLAPWTQLAAITVATWVFAAAAILLLGAYLSRSSRERERAQAQVQQVTQRLSLALTAANISVWDWDLTADQWYATPTYFSMLGYDPAEGFVDNARWLDRIHPDDRDTVAARIKEALGASGTPYQYQARIRHANGSYRWISVSGHAVASDDAGRPTRLLGVTQDVTRSMEAESALRDSEAHYRELFRDNPHPMWIFDLETLAFLDVNDTAVRHYGYSRAEFLGMTIRDIRPPEDLAALDAHLGDVRRGTGAPEPGPWRHRRKDGSLILVETASHTLNFAGRPARFIHAHDVTERERTQAQIRASEENLAITLQSIGDAVIATDACGTITRINPTAERLTGWPASEAVGRALDEVFHIIHAQTRAQALNPVDQVMQHGQMVGLANHTALLARDGHEYQIFDSAAPIRDPAGQVVGVVLVFSDVTAQYETQAALQRSEARLKATLDALPDLLFETDADGRYHDYHSPRHDLLRTPPDEFLGKTVTELMPPEPAAVVLEALREAGLQGYSNSRQIALDLAVGRRWFELSVARKPVLPGEPSRFIVLSRDVTARVQAQAALEHNEQRFRTLIEWTPDAVIVHQEGRLVYVNPAAVRLLGAASTQDLLGRPVMDFVHPDYHRTVQERVGAVLGKGIAAPLLEQRFLRLDGSAFDVEVQGTRIDFNGRAAVQVVLRDITGRKLAQERLAASAVALREAALHTQTILDNMADCVITVTAQGLVESFNKAAVTVFGHAPEEVLGRAAAMLLPEPHRSQYVRLARQPLDDAELRLLGVPREVEGLRKDGSLFPMSLVVSQVTRAGQTTFISIVRDITQHRRDVEEIRRLAFYDLLTGLPNRRLLMDRLRQAMVTSARIGQHGALMFLDLDHFKALNDTLGHDVGDVLLQQAARRVQSCVREGDSVARLGGDEFVVLLEALSQQPHEAATQAEVVASKILDVFQQPFILRNHQYDSTPSIGIVVFLGDRDDIDNLLKKADVAMYQAKAAGRNTARFFDPAMQAVVVAHEALEKDLRRGLAADEFVLHYQVQVDRAGTPVGAEALVRWAHASRGMLSPANFIALAEETGLILPLGQWVLETACAQLVQWAKQPGRADWTVAVNVSASQFAQTEFVAKVDTALRKTGANPRLLKLELTESTLVEDVEAVIAKMNALKAFGVGFSLDDFGTGYSSLSYLKRLPLDQLKIDQSFVRDVLTDPSDAVIARTIIALGHSLALGVIAEGVETAEQRDFLSQAGCDAFQGYYFGRPGPAQALAGPPA